MDHQLRNKGLEKKEFARLKAYLEEHVLADERPDDCHDLIHEGHHVDEVDGHQPNGHGSLKVPFGNWAKIGLCWLTCR